MAQAGPLAPVRFVVGMDVGSRSLGLSAIEIDEDGTPIRLLSSVSFIHDGGVDPNSGKKRVSRLASSGLARRTRRRLQRRRRRLADLDALLETYNWRNDSRSDDPWLVRACLASTHIADAEERGRFLAIAVRHIARHRGWRNPYSRTESLLSPTAPSEAFQDLRAAASKQTSRLPADVTVAQLAAVLLKVGTGVRNRKDRTEAVLGWMQSSDLANELHTIAAVQRLPDHQVRALIEAIFTMTSSKGAQQERIAADPLPTHLLPGVASRLPRASKATDEFQRYRLASIIANLRVKTTEGPKALCPSQRRKVFEYLLAVKATHDPTWDEVADLLGVPREHLRGTATTTADGERSYARPPVHVTDRTLRKSSIKPVRNWWKTASESHRAAMVATLSNAATDVANLPEVDDFIATLTPDQMGKLESLELPRGRAAYSRQSMEALTRQMLETTDDLHAARTRLFGVAEDWEPPADPIGTAVGNPAVDRVIKQVARWLLAVEANWGRPERITLEHVRDAFVSERKKREADARNDAKRKARDAIADAVAKAFGVNKDSLTPSQFRKYEQVTRQNGCCLYCDAPITVKSAQLDHIVPRATPGSSSRGGNLAAACRRCNDAKNNTPFGAWAATTTIPGVSVAAAIERVMFWNKTPGQHDKAHKALTEEVISRLRRTEYDPPLDDRSLESLGWMANELATRIRQHFNDPAKADEVLVHVFRGALVAEARRASAVEWSVPWIGGSEGGKTRYDRRHHAVDASVVAMLDDRSVAQTLAERIALHADERDRDLPKHTLGWKTHEGRTETSRKKFAAWQTRMDALALLLADAMSADSMPVQAPLRLSPGGRRHEDGVRSLYRRQVGDEMTAALIDAASAPALWCALTRHPDYDPVKGLPTDPRRTIRLHGKHLGATDEIAFFDIEGQANTTDKGTPKKSAPASIAVRGGSAEIGVIHHARIYRIDGTKRPTYAMLRVYVTDLPGATRKGHGRDLFSPTDTPLLPQSISMRTTSPALRTALITGTATYLGWLIKGDEIHLPNPLNAGKAIAAFETECPGTTRWRVSGFEDNARIGMRPAQLSGEGLPDNAPDAIQKPLLDSNGARANLNSLLNSGDVTIVRRDALGRERWRSSKHLPVCWRVR